MKRGKRRDREKKIKHEKQRKKRDGKIYRGEGGYRQSEKRRPWKKRIYITSHTPN